MTERCIPVALGDRSYHLHIGAGLLASGRAAQITAHVAPGKRVCIVTHPALRSAYADPLAAGLREQGIDTMMALLPAGERFKHLLRADDVLKSRAKFLRQSAVCDDNDADHDCLFNFNCRSSPRTSGRPALPPLRSQLCQAAT